MLPTLHVPSLDLRFVLHDPTSVVDTDHIGEEHREACSVGILLVHWTRVLARASAVDYDTRAVRAGSAFVGLVVTLRIGPSSRSISS
jgi:hypothetical protein